MRRTLLNPFALLVASLALVIGACGSDDSSSGGDTHGHSHTDSDGHGHSHTDTDGHGHTDTDGHGHTDTDGHGHTDTDGHGHTDTDGHGHTDTDGHGHTDTDSGETGEVFARLVVSRGGDEPGLTIHDMGQAEVETVETFALPAGAALYAGSEGRYVYAVMTSANQVQIFDAGLWIDDHGDHVHEEREAPSHVHTFEDWPRPIHVAINFPYVAVFNDGSSDGEVNSSVALIDQNAVHDGAPTADVFDIGTAHHGGVVVPDDFIVSTVKAEGEEFGGVPDHIMVMDLDGQELARFEDSCPGTHGNAGGPVTSNGGVAAFGCIDGTLLVWRDAAGDFESKKLVFPDLEEEGTRVGTVRGLDGFPVFVTSWGRGKAAVGIADPDADALVQVSLAAPMMAFTIDPYGDNRALALLANGELADIDTDAATVRSSTAVISAWQDDDPRPILTVAAGRAWIWDANEEELVQFNLDTSEVERRIELDGGINAVLAISPL